ncbi:MAG: ABC transporter permease [Lachnospiraceae bacterium]|nr:ABC transporter permease [Lachnospiraceae bacterium]
MKKALKNKKIVLLIVNIIVIVVMIGIRFTIWNNVSLLYAEQAGQRYSTKKEKSGHIAVFTDRDNAITNDNIKSARVTVNNSLRDEDLLGDNTKSRKWIDCYSCETDVNFKRGEASFDTKAMLVGADFFIIHPIPLVSGTYFTENDPDKFRVIIDENLAWNLFGSPDICGKELIISGHIYTIAGVVESGYTNFSKIAMGTANRMYLPYQSYVNYSKSSSGDMTSKSTSSDTNASVAQDAGSDADVSPENFPITCYEVVMPDPVKNFALNIVKKAMNISTDNSEATKDSEVLNFEGIEVVDITSRYGFLTLLSNAKNFYYRAMKTNAIIYPYWENEARMVEYNASIFYLLLVILGLVPFITICRVLYKGIPFCIQKIKDLHIMDRIYNFRSRKNKSVGNSGGLVS